MQVTNTFECSRFSILLEIKYGCCSNKKNGHNYSRFSTVEYKKISPLFTDIFFPNDVCGIICHHNEINQTRFFSFEEFNIEKKN